MFKIKQGCTEKKPCSECRIFQGCKHSIEVITAKKFKQDRSMRCIGTLARSWPEKLAGMVNGTMPYLMRVKN